MEHLIGRIAHQSVEKISLDATKYIGGQGLGLQTTRAYDLSDLFRTYFLGAIMTSLACTNLKSERTFSGAMLWIEPKRIIYMPAYVDREKINKRPYEIIVIGEKESEIPDLLLHSSDAYDIKEQFFRLFQINVEMRQQNKVRFIQWFKDMESSCQFQIKFHKNGILHRKRNGIKKLPLALIIRPEVDFETNTITHKSLESGATAVPVVPDFLKTMEFFVQNYFDVLGIPKMRSMVTCFMLGAGSVLHHQYDATIHNRYRLDIIGNFHLADSNIIQPPHAPNQRKTNLFLNFEESIESEFKLTGKTGIGINLHYKFIVENDLFSWAPERNHINQNLFDALEYIDVVRKAGLISTHIYSFLNTNHKTSTSVCYSKLIEHLTSSKRLDYQSPQSISSTTVSYHQQNQYLTETCPTYEYQMHSLFLNIMNKKKDQVETVVALHILDAKDSKFNDELLFDPILYRKLSETGADFAESFYIILNLDCQQNRVFRDDKAVLRRTGYFSQKTEGNKFSIYFGRRGIGESKFATIPTTLEIRHRQWIPFLQKLPEFASVDTTMRFIRAENWKKKDSAQKVNGLRNKKNREKIGIQNTDVPNKRRKQDSIATPEYSSTDSHLEVKQPNTNSVAMIASEPNKLGPVYYGTDFTQFDAPNDDNTQITSETINSGNVAPILSEYNLDSSHLDHLPSMEAISVEYNEGRNNLFEIDSIYSENNIDKYHQEESSILSNSDSGILPEDHGQPFNDQHVGDDMDSMWEQIDGILNEESRRATQDSIQLDNSLSIVDIPAEFDDEHSNLFEIDSINSEKDGPDNYPQTESSISTNTDDSAIIFNDHDQSIDYQPTEGDLEDMDERIDEIISLAMTGNSDEDPLYGFLCTY